MSVAHERPVRTRGRLTAWIGNVARSTPRAVVEATEDCSTLVARRTFAEIGEFLFGHGLSLTAANLDIAFRYLSGSDFAVGEKMRMLLREHPRLTDVLLDRLVAEVTPGVMTAEAVGSVADRLQGRLDDCVRLVERSSASATSYGDAFDQGVARLEAGHADAVSQLRATARDLVRTTREMQAALDRQRQQANRLRGELQQARREAERDHLTGLPNRRCFEAKVKEASEPGRIFVVALCDIDDFKLINDEHGHQTGDRVLRLVGSHLERELKGRALVARHGGEEFALFFPQATATEAADIIDRTRQRLAARSLVDQESGRTLRRLTFSAGVALLDGDVGTALRAADRALYQAKRLGKNQVLLSDAAMASTAAS